MHYCYVVTFLHVRVSFHVIHQGYCEIAQFRIIYDQTRTTCIEATVASFL
jgi:hypothetical protein